MPAHTVLRPGDRVVVISPQRVVRCGYPKCIDDFRNEALADFGQVLKDKLKTLIDRDHPIITEIARQMLIKAKYGGPERSLHLEPCPELEGKELVVEGVRTAMTGYYVPGYRESGGYYGDYDEWVPARLDDVKARRLAAVYVPGQFRMVDGPKKLEFPVEYLRKVEVTHE